MRCAVVSGQYHAGEAELYDRCHQMDDIVVEGLNAKHYGFTEDELVFIINYEIKYRMGDELNAE